MIAIEIRKFVIDKLAHSGRAIQGTDKDAEQLINTIVRKADGVFLWVHLAMDFILEALDNHDGWSQAKLTVDQLPSLILELYAAKLSRIGLNDPKTREEAAAYLQACLAHGSEQVELSVLVSLRAKIDGQSVIDTSFNKRRLFQSYEELLDRIPRICTGMLQCEKRDFDLISEHLQKPGDASIINGNCIDRKNNSVLFPIAKLSHRAVRDFLLDAKEGNDLLAESPLSNDDVFLGFVEANLMRSLFGLKFFRLGGAITKISPSWSSLVTKLSEDTLNQALTLIEKSLPRIALAQNRLREETKQMLVAGEERSWLNVQFDLLASDVSSHWPKSIAIDIDGLALEHQISSFTSRPTLKLLREASDSQPRLSQRYKDYLLLCCLHRHSSTLGAEGDKTLISTLIDEGADPYAVFFLPPSEARSISVVAELVPRFYLDFRLDNGFDFWISLLKRIEIKSQRCMIRAFTGSLQYITSSTPTREGMSFMDIWIELDVADYIQDILEVLQLWSTSNLRKPLHLMKDGLTARVMLSEAKWPFDEDERPIYVSLLDEKDSASILRMIDTGVEQDRIELEMRTQRGMDLDKIEARWEQFHMRIEELHKSSSVPKVELTAFLRDKGYIPDPSDQLVLKGPIPRFETIE